MIFPGESSSRFSDSFMSDDGPYPLAQAAPKGLAAGVRLRRGTRKPVGLMSGYRR